MSYCLTFQHAWPSHINNRIIGIRSTRRFHSVGTYLYCQRWNGLLTTYQYWQGSYGNCGIFLSVAIAFVVGLIVMWITRIIFTFNYKKHQRWSIALYGGFSVTLIIYFILAVSLKNASFFQGSPFALFVNEHSFLFLLYAFIGSTVLVQILHLMHVEHL